MPAFWTIENWPHCEYHVFLSHCAEDREKLVLPVYRRLQDLNVTPWIDQHDYPSGREPFEALRENLLRCRNIVYIITPSMLRQPRGWAVAERTCGALIQQNLHFKTFDIQSVELPLFLVGCGDRRLPRSVWRTLIDRGRFLPPRARRINWCVDEIRRFLNQEQHIAQQMAIAIGRSPQLRTQFGSDENLRARVVGASPLPAHFKP